MTGDTRSTRRTGRRAAPARSRFGQVQQLPSGRYRARYTTPDGARRTGPTTFDTRTEAEHYLTQVHAELLRGHAVNLMPTTTTVGDYVRAWLDTATHLRPTTAQHYQRLACNWLLAPVGNVHLAPLALPDLTVSLVRTWHTELLAATAAAASTPPPPPRTVHPARAWARAAGVQVPATGRLPERVTATWRAAGSPAAPAGPDAAAATGVAPGRTAAAHAYRLLRTIMGQAVRDGLIQHNPVQVKGAATAPRTERQPLTLAEVTALAEAVQPRFAAAVLTGAFSGLRPGELFALRRADMDAAAGTLAVRRTMLELDGQPVTYGPPKTAAGLRTVALPATITAALAAHLDTYTAEGPEALIFTTAHGHPLTKTRRARVLREARASIGRPDVSWHHLRHTGATLAAISGATLAELQRRIGHATPRAAMLYQHASASRDHDLAHRLDALITHAAPEPASTVPGPAFASVNPAGPAAALATIHPDTLTAPELAATLATLPTTAPRTSAHTMVEALLTERAQVTGVLPTVVADLAQHSITAPHPDTVPVPGPALERTSAEAAAPASLPIRYIARRFGHLSVISAIE